MKTLLLLMLLVQTAEAASTGTVIQVARRFRMSYLEPMPAKDYFIDLGTRDGIKAGNVLEVSRQIPVANAYSGGAWHLMKVALGDVKVVFVGESTCIGRVIEERDASSLPAMEYPTIMLGDEVAVKAVAALPVAPGLPVIPGVPVQ